MQVYVQFFAFLLSALASLIPGLGHWLGVIGQVQPRTEAQAEPPDRRPLQWTGGTGSSRVLELSNLYGRVVIVAEERGDVAVVATRTVERRGLASEPLPQADVRQAGERLLVCGDSTRCGCHIDMSPDARSRRDRRRGDDRPRIRVDFEVRVPRAVTLDICAVNAEVVRVEGTSGPYTVRNVNGNIELRRVGGQGRAHTVNGDIDATFALAPTGASSFTSVNGDLDVTMPANLAADVRMRTMHGGLYTDFETTALPRRAATPERHGSRTVYRSDGHAAVRVGAGGPELTFETLNGDVRLRRP